MRVFNIEDTLVTALIGDCYAVPGHFMDAVRVPP